MYYLLRRLIGEEFGRTYCVNRCQMTIHNTQYIIQFYCFPNRHNQLQLNVGGFRYVVRTYRVSTNKQYLHIATMCRCRYKCYKTQLLPLPSHILIRTLIIVNLYFNLLSRYFGLGSHAECNMCGLLHIRLRCVAQIWIICHRFWFIHLLLLLLSIIDKAYSRPIPLNILVQVCR